MQDYFSMYYERIANNIKRLRLSLDLSQEDFAESISCSREYISRLENHKEKISLKLILTISKIYNHNPEDFFKIKK